MSTEHDVYENEDLNIFDGKEEAEVEGGKKHSYLMDERETVLLYSEIDNAWTISTNVRKHISKLMKRPETYTVIREEKDEETGRTIYIEVLVDDLANVTLQQNKKACRNTSLFMFISVRQDLLISLEKK